MALSGTVRSNRYNYPKDLLTEQLEKGGAVFYQNLDSTMVACKYRATKDKAGGQQKVVYMLSICDQPTTIECRDGHMTSRKPVAVQQYNMHMGGVGVL